MIVEAVEPAGPPPMTTTSEVSGWGMGEEAGGGWKVGVPPLGGRGRLKPELQRLGSRRADREAPHLLSNMSPSLSTPECFAKALPASESSPVWSGSNRSPPRWRDADLRRGRTL